MPESNTEIIEKLKTFDSATVFNAMVEKLGLPNEDYTSHDIRYLLPEFGASSWLCRNCGDNHQRSRLAED